MDPTAVSQSIPMTAWQQAVIVVLFIFFLGGVYAFVRWLLNWVKAFQREWQTFTDRQNRDFREWMEKQRNQDRSILTDIISAIKELGQKIDAHDDKVDERIEKVTTRRRKL
jgi:Sec-independent protein translocase protein TatA